MFLITGDVNINMLGNDVSTREFKNIIKSYACENLINLSTRITAESATLLDVCITNIFCQDATAGLLTLDISDHLPVFCFLPVVKAQDTKISASSYRSVNSKSLETFRSHIEKVN